MTPNDLRDRIVEIIGTSDAYTEPGDAADAILALVADVILSDEAQEAAQDEFYIQDKFLRDAFTAALRASGIAKGERHE